MGRKLRNAMKMPERLKAAERIKKRNAWIDPLVAQRARTHFGGGKIIHCDRLHSFPVRYDQDGAWEAFIDTLPRKPTRFLAMVAEQERKRQLTALIEAKRAKGRERYLRRMKR